MKPIEKILLSLSCIIIACFTTPLELTMLPSHLHPYLIGWKIYQFIVAPIAVMYFLRRREREKEKS